jgi:hypothetical protein
MAIYQVNFVDHGDNVYASESIEHDDEPALVETLRRRHTHGIGAGFDIWEGDRLIYRHRK